MLLLPVTILLLLWNCFTVTVKSMECDGGGLQLVDISFLRICFMHMRKWFSLIRDIVCRKYFRLSLSCPKAFVCMKITCVDLMTSNSPESLGVVSFCCVVDLMLCQANKSWYSFQEDRGRRTKNSAQKSEELGRIALAERHTKRQS